MFGCRRILGLITNPQLSFMQAVVWVYPMIPWKKGWPRWNLNILYGHQFNVRYERPKKHLFGQIHTYMHIDIFYTIYTIYIYICACVCVRAEFNFKHALMLVVFAWIFDLQDVESPVHPGALQLCPRSCGGFFRVLAASEVVWSGVGEAILGIFNRLKPSRFIVFLFMIVFSQWEIQDLESEKQILCIFLVSFLEQIQVVWGRPSPGNQTWLAW